MATPHVAATVALMFEKNPYLDYETIYNTLLDYAEEGPTPITITVGAGSTPIEL